MQQLILQRPGSLRRRAQRQRRWRECRSLGTACCCWCAPGGDDPSPRRRGISKVSRLTRRSSPPAPFPATRLRSYACYRCVARSSATWTCSAVLDLARLLERALRASAYLPDRARLLYAMDRRLRAASLRARAWRRPDHHDRHDGRHVRAHTISRMHRLLHPNSNSCITVFHASPAQASHSLNSPAHTRMF